MNLCALPGRGASAGMTMVSKNSSRRSWAAGPATVAGLAVDGALACDVDVARPAQRQADAAVGHVVDVARLLNSVMYGRTLLSGRPPPVVGRVLAERRRGSARQPAPPRTPSPRKLTPQLFILLRCTPGLNTRSHTLSEGHGRAAERGLTFSTLMPTVVKHSQFTGSRLPGPWRPALLHRGRRGTSGWDLRLVELAQQAAVDLQLGPVGRWHDDVVSVLPRHQLGVEDLVVVVVVVHRTGCRFPSRSSSACLRRCSRTSCETLRIFSSSWAAGRRPSKPTRAASQQGGQAEGRRTHG